MLKSQDGISILDKQPELDPDEQARQSLKIIKIRTPINRMESNNDPS